MPFQGFSEETNRYFFGAELENEVADFFAKLTPLYTYFTRFGA